MTTKCVRDIMIPLEKYPHVHDSDTLLQAIIEMGKYQIETEGKMSLPRVVLVFSPHDDQLVGVLRRRDILRGLEPQFLVSKPLSHRKSLFDIPMDPNLSEMSLDRLEKGMVERAQQPVRDVMRTVDVTIDFDDHVIKAAYEMVDNNVSVLPVIQNNRVVGVVRSAEVLRDIARILLHGNENET